MISRPRRLLELARADDGFTMLIALGVLFVTGVLLAAAFMAVQGDTPVARDDTTQQQAYYAALSGIQEYEYKLESNANFWEGCETLSSVEEGNERYEVTLVPAEGKTLSSCSTSPFSTIIESKGTAADTFRIVSTGCAGEAKLARCPSESEQQTQFHRVTLWNCVCCCGFTWAAREFGFARAARSRRSGRCRPPCLSTL